MIFSDLREKFDPVIDSIFQEKTQVEICSIMKDMLSPHLDKIEDLIPGNIRNKFNEGSFEGLEEECHTARDEIDLRIGLSEEEGASSELIDRLDDAGVLLEATSYLNPDKTSKETLFDFFYCLLAVVTEDEIISQAEAELS